MPALRAKESDVDDLKELLPLAAKAAGVEWQPGYHWDAETGLPLEFNQFSWQMVYWNPITDDGDAFRLAVKLEMNLSLALCGWVEVDGHDTLRHEFGTGDPLAATRLAVVRAAAEIGRAMP